MSGISGPAVHSCPWCGRSVEQGESCWCKGSQEAAMTRQEIKVELDAARRDNDRLTAENARLNAMLGEEAKRRKEAEAARDMLREALTDLAAAEMGYRIRHDVYGDGSPHTGRAWDLMRRAGDKARAVRAALKPAGGE